MKFSLQLPIVLLLAGLVLNGCRKDNLFKGKDNDIASFQLKKGDQLLSAYIQNDSIVVIAPGNMDLSGATSIIVLSERARISPDPSTVADWTQSHDFVVTSYDGATRNFKYVLQRNVISKDGDIILMTQADVDTLAKMGLSRINGSLTIGKTTGADSIRTLAGLSSLKSIAYDLIINSTYAGKDLTGLDNLETVGSFRIGTDDNSFHGPLMNLKTISLPKLTEVIANMVINGPGITTLQLPVLAKIDLGLKLLNLDSLTTIGLPKLKSVSQSMDLEGSQSGSSVSLKTISLPALETVGADCTIAYWSNLETISLPLLISTSSLSIAGETVLTTISAPKLQTVYTDINFRADQEMAMLDLSSLRTVGGSFYLESSGVLDNLNGLKALTSVGGDLSISSLPALKDITALKALQSVGGSLMLQSLDLLEDQNLESLSGVKTIGADLLIYGVPFKKFTGFALTKLQSVSIYGSGITTIEQIDLSKITISTSVLISGITGGIPVKGADVLGGSLTLDGSDVSLSGFKQVGGDLIISWPYDVPPAPSATLALPFQKVSGNLNIDLSNSNADQVSLPQLTLVNGDCTFYTGTSTFSVADLQVPLLTTVNGILSVGSYDVNTRMTNLNGFGALTSVKGVSVFSNQALTDFTGLKNAFGSFTADSWSVYGNLYNPSYQDMVDGNYAQP